MRDAINWGIPNAGRTKKEEQFNTPVVTMSAIIKDGAGRKFSFNKAAAEALGIQSVLSDFGTKVKVEIHSDATAAIGICKRQGLGRVRHLATADLWVQQKVRARELKLFKLPGKEKPSDLMAKHKTAPEASRFMSMLGIHSLPGRPLLAPARVPQGTHPCSNDGRK